MSLINDALKRARESQRKNPPAGAPQLRPIESPARGGTGWMLAVAAVLFLAAAGLFIGPALFGRKAAPVVTAKVPEISAPPPAAAAPLPMPPRVDAASLPPAVTNAAPPPAAYTNPPPAVASEQVLKIQGIIFSVAHPEAIVNGKDVIVGDRVGDFQVKEILRDSVVFQRPDGSQKTLVIGE
jgi:hypothetical protein